MFLSTSFIRLIPAVALVGVDSSLERKKKQNAKQLRKVVDPQSANQIQRSRDRIKRFMVKLAYSFSICSPYYSNFFQVERGVPGLSVGVTVNGKFVWKEGEGKENYLKLKSFATFIYRFWLCGC